MSLSNLTAAQIDDVAYGNSLTGAAKQQWDWARNEKQDLRWLVEQEIRKKLGVPAEYEPVREKIEFHRRQLALLLDKANEAPRCAHVFADGRCCAAPRVRKGTLCYAHAQMEARKPQTVNLPPLEDANAVMIWIMEVSRGLLDGKISERTAGLMFYGLQLAMITARHTTFKETNPLEMVRTAPKHRRDRRRPIELTAKDAKIAKEENGPGSVSSATKTKTITAEVAESAEEIEADGAEKLQVEGGNPGVESAKSIFFGVDGIEGVARSGDRDIG